MTTTLDVEIVVAKYKENLDWLLDTVRVRDARITVYDKGGDLCEKKRQGGVTRLPLPNVGRETHTILTHIVNNYDQLADITVFTQGNIDDHVKYLVEGRKIMGNPTPVQYLMMLAKSATDNETGLSKNAFVQNVVYENAPVREFRKLMWTGKAQRPCAEGSFGQWWDKWIGKDKPMPPFREFLWYLGAVFAVRKENILSRPKSWYESLLATVSDSCDIEDGHYLERAWYYMLGGIRPVCYACPTLALR